MFISPIRVFASILDIRVAVGGTNEEQMCTNQYAVLILTDNLS